MDFGHSIIETSSYDEDLFTVVKDDTVSVAKTSETFDSTFSFSNDNNEQHHADDNDTAGFIDIHSNTLIEVRLKDIPEHLKTSELYDQFDVSDTDSIRSDSDEWQMIDTSVVEVRGKCDKEMIELPLQYFKTDLKITSSTELKHWLSTARYWGCRYDNDTNIMNYTLQEPTNALKVLEDYLELAYSSKIIQGITAARKGEIRSFLCKMAGKGYADIIQFFLPQHPFVRHCTKICTAAALHGHIDVLRVCYKFGCQWDANTTAAAAKGGHLDCLRFLHLGKCAWTHTTAMNAAAGGHLNCLQYAYQNGCPWNDLTCLHAAKNGYIRTLKFAHKHGCPWGRGVCQKAAEHGYLNILKYAHEHGCPWDVGTCFSAARYGHLDCLQYAHENKCPSDGNTTSTAQHYGHEACRAYAELHGL